MRFDPRETLKTVWSNLCILSRDVSFNRCVRMLVLVVIVAFCVFTVLWLCGVGLKVEVGGPGGGQHALGFQEYLFNVIGAVDAHPDSMPLHAYYVVLVRLIGAIIIGGVITSFLCTMVVRYSNMALHGLLDVNLSGHTVIIGCCKYTDDLIRRILEGEDFESWYPDKDLFSHEIPEKERGRILLYTGEDVRHVRERLANLLPSGMVSQIEYVSGEMDISQKNRREIVRRTCLRRARRVFVLGDDSSAMAGDIGNYAFADRLMTFLSDRERRDPFPIYLRMDHVPSFDMMKKINYNLGDDRVSLIPFGFDESWARTVFGDVSTEYEPLDFRPMADDDYVHLVVGGMTGLGTAMAIEAARVAHYMTEKPTRITFVDMMEVKYENFRAAYSGLVHLPDLEFDFKRGTLSSPEVRSMLEREAANPHCLLTVAVCYTDQDLAFESAVNLPASVYLTPETRDHDERVPRILVYIEHDPGENRRRAHDSRYRFLQPFGWQDEGVQHWCLKRFPAMLRSWIYDYDHNRGDGNEARWFERYARRPFLDLYRSEYEAIRRRAFDNFVAKDSVEAWGNVYFLDFSGTVLRQLGFRSVAPSAGMSVEEFAKKVDKGAKMFFAALEGDVLERFSEAEHRRWMADSVLHGYLPDSDGTCGKTEVSKMFRRHGCIRNYFELSEEKHENDRDSIRCIAFILAFMGYYIDRRDG